MILEISSNQAYSEGVNYLDTRNFQTKRSKLINIVFQRFWRAHFEIASFQDRAEQAFENSCALSKSVKVYSGEDLFEDEGMGLIHQSCQKIHVPESPGQSEEVEKGGSHLIFDLELVGSLLLLSSPWCHIVSEYCLFLRPSYDLRDFRRLSLAASADL